VINSVTIDLSTGQLVCTCGARSGKNGVNRFNSRHPEMCSSRREWARQLAKGTRHIDDLETNREPPTCGGRVGTV
jgi:hypothetical protein